MLSRLALLLIEHFGTMRNARALIPPLLVRRRNPNKFAEHFAHMMKGTPPAADVRGALSKLCWMCPSELESALASDAANYQAWCEEIRQRKVLAEENRQHQVRAYEQRVFQPAITIYHGPVRVCLKYGDPTSMLRLSVSPALIAAITARDLEAQLALVQETIQADQREPSPSRVRCFGQEVRGYSFIPTWNSCWVFTSRGELDYGHSALPRPPLETLY